MVEDVHNIFLNVKRAFVLTSLDFAHVSKLNAHSSQLICALNFTLCGYFFWTVLSFKDF